MTRVTVTSGGSTRVLISSLPRTAVRSVALQPQTNISNTVNNIYPSGAARFIDLLDVDASDSDNNEVVVFDSTANTYVVKTLPTVDGGDF